MDNLIEFATSEPTALAVGIFAAIIMLIVSGIHIFWALGGRWGFEAAIPEFEGRPIYPAGSMGIFTIAFLLLMGALIILGRVGLFGKPDPEIVYLWGPGVMAFLFFIRGIGDLHFVGLFKKFRSSYFAYWDTRLFTPISIFLGFACTIVAYSPVSWHTGP